MALGANIKKAREQRGWSTYEMAARAGLQQSSVSRIEAGHIRPRPETLRKIADVLAIEVRVLEYGSDLFDVVPLGSRRIPVLTSAEIMPWVQRNLSSQGGTMNTTLVEASYSAGSFGMVVRGQHMMPEYQEGDLIIVDPAVTPEPGDDVVADAEKHGVVLRRYKSVGINSAGEEVFELLPVNPFHPNLRSDQLAITLIGTVMGYTRNIKKPPTTK